VTVPYAVKSSASGSLVTYLLPAFVEGPSALSSNRGPK
jgi:hypothetical protein